jgi:hypothetical protein
VYMSSRRTLGGAIQNLAIPHKIWKGGGDKHWGIGDERTGSIFNQLREVINLLPKAEQYTPVFLLGYYIT